MQDLFLFTFNCSKRLVHSDELADAIGMAFNEQPVAVFAFQEVCPIMEACLKESRQYVGAIQHSIERALGPGYTRMDTVTVGAVALLVYISAGDAYHTSAIVRNGLLRSSLKGAAAMRVTLSDNEYTFVASHLSAGEGATVARNQDYVDLATWLDFGDGYGAYKRGSHLFVLGDLNYRAVKTPFDDREPQTEGLLGNFENDELTGERQRGNTLFGMEEARVEFNPTYKFIEGTEIYNTKRIPSWCDRILYQRCDGNCVVHAYKSLPASTSDHKPVYLSISVPKPANVVGQNGDLLNEDRRINLALDPSRKMYAMSGEISDMAIGWGLYLTITRTGNLYLLGGCLAFYLCYLFANWF